MGLQLPKNLLYRINGPRIVHETLDNETIIIDFDTGTYYSLSGTAYWIWFLIEKKQALVQIVNQITTSYTGEPEQIDAAVRQFVGKLAQAEIIVKTEAPLGVAEPLVLANKVPFTPPILEEHTDIQDLLLLDPIHEVGKQGWPMRQA